MIRNASVQLTGYTLIYCIGYIEGLGSGKRGFGWKWDSGIEVETSVFTRAHVVDEQYDFVSV